MMLTSEERRRLESIKGSNDLSKVAGDISIGLPMQMSMEEKDNLARSNKKVKTRIDSSSTQGVIEEEEQAGHEA